MKYYKKIKHIQIIINLSFCFILFACHDLNQNLIHLKDNPVKNNILIETSSILIKKTKPKLTIKPIVKLVAKSFKLNSLINIPKNKLYNLLGEEDFLKTEGKLKNFQYYFSECYLDVFFLNKQRKFMTNFIKMRSTKLAGNINKIKCLKEISNRVNHPPEFKTSDNE